MRRTQLLLAVVAIGVFATGAAAATLTVTDVARPRPGRLRIALRYEAAGRPGFRLVRICPALPRLRRTLAATVSVAGARKEVVLDVRDDPTGLVVRRPPCPVFGLTVEMMQRGRVVARAEVPSIPLTTTIASPTPPPPPSAIPSRLGFAGGKYLAPQTRMSQAGLTWSLSDRVKLLLSYERTAFAPTMSRDHDDGIVTGLKLTF